MSDHKDMRRAVRVVVRDIVKEELNDTAVDFLAIRAVLLRGFWGRMRWLLTGK